MKKLLPFLLLSCLMIFSCKEKENPKLRIAVAANMQFAMKDLTAEFTKTTGIECETNISSSGKLTAQIKEKAPIDIFVSADMKYPTELYKDGFTTAKPEIYAYGKLVLWTMTENLKPTVEILTDPKIKHIAIANPKMAPYGKATIEVLEHEQILNQVKEKLVYGESISQANQFIISKAAEIGFTAKSVVLSPEMKGKGIWIDLDEKLYTPIAQGAVIIKHGDVKNESAEKFYQFLFSSASKKILQNYGYR